ncbi:hypothetical protein QBC37DRAFT_96295 [Rhypophila decipiens]|uniref:Nephrocystin 3-like N-terminal domain-containing protein n=1 Tax=Rhypophila decipiens TaxID=261697 RepID=A0AAN6XVG6_9PEZI|nr:hypothetical protein QBC37DRAFT_96295 [Rhypophila decipiens]
MEAIVAIGLSSDILQFIEVTKKLVSSAEQIFKHGGSLEYLELEKTAQRLRDVAERITFRELELDRGIDASLIGLCRDCISITNELLPILDSLKVGDDGRKWRSAQQALKARWKKEEVDALERRLDRIGKTLTTHSMMSQQEAIGRKLHDLEDRSHRDNAQRTNEMESLKVQLREAFELLREDLRNGEQQQARMQRLRDITGRHTWGIGPTDLSELGSITGKEAQYAAEQIVLQQFRFPGIDDRYDGVHAAHDKTFAWVFAPTTTSEASCKASSNFTPFRNWFASDDRLFWITGKPGSGKSTLMKYLCSHEQTGQRLAQ